MKKRILFILTLSFLSSFAMAQMYVAGNGNIGIGTTNPTCKFQINSSNNNFTFKPSNSGSLEIGGYDGSTNSTITFWHSTTGFNKLMAKSFTRSSDSTLKTNVQLLVNPIDVIKRINGYSYFYRENPSQRGNKEYGVIAQEEERVLPELVDTIKGIKVVDYDGLIPFLLEAVKEQQKQIESLTQEIMLLKQLGLQQNDEPKGASNQNLSLEEQKSDKLQVYQNAPNPFNTTTNIKCYIPENISNAKLCFYDMGGSLMKCYSIQDRGLVDLQIQSGSLSAGIYVYVLTGDGQTSDTKQMVLTK